MVGEKLKETTSTVEKLQKLGKDEDTNEDLVRKEKKLLPEQQVKRSNSNNSTLGVINLVNSKNKGNKVNDEKPIRRVKTDDNQMVVTRMTTRNYSRIQPKCPNLSLDENNSTRDQNISLVTNESRIKMTASSSGVGSSHADRHCFIGEKKVDGVESKENTGSKSPVQNNQTSKAGTVSTATASDSNIFCTKGNFVYLMRGGRLIRRFKKRDNKGRGDCLFRVFSNHIFGFEGQHFEMRSRIVEFVCSHWNELVDQLRAMSVVRFYENAEQYKHVMGARGEYGTDFELSMFVRMYNVPVRVFCEEEFTKRIIQAGSLKSPSESKSELLNILFIGDAKFGHWLELLEDKSAITSGQTAEFETTDSRLISEITTDQNFDDAHSDGSADSGARRKLCETEECPTNVELSSQNEAEELPVSRVLDEADTRKNLEGNGPNDTLPSKNPSAHTELDARETQGNFSDPEIPQHQKSQPASPARNETLTSEVYMQSSILSQITGTQLREKINDDINRRLRDTGIPCYARQQHGEDVFEFGELDRGSSSSYEESSSKSSHSSSSSESEAMSSDSTDEEERCDVNSSKGRSSDKSDELSDGVAKKTRKKLGRNNGRKLKKKSKKKKKRKSKPGAVFSVNLGAYEILRADLRAPSTVNPREDTWCPELIKFAYEKIVVETIGCTCFLSPYGRVRENRNSIVAYARCGFVNHEQRFKFKFERLDDPNVTLVISSTGPIKFHHRSIAAGEKLHFKQVRGSVRTKLIHTLSQRSVREVENDQAEKHLDRIDVISDGHMLDLRNRNVAYRVKSEQNMTGRLTLQSTHLSDLIQLGVEHSKMKTGRYVQHVGIPLRVEMYTDSALETTRGRKKKVGHMDATANICKEPQDFVGKLIMIYTLVYRHDDELVRIAELITCDHSTPSISNWLSNVRANIERSSIPGVKMPLFDIIIIDWSWVELHALLKAWNDMDIRSYLRLVFHCIDNGIPFPLAIVILYICYAHFMHLVSRSIDKNFPVYKSEGGKELKKTLLECMSVIALTRDWKKMQNIFQHFCTFLCARSMALARESLQHIVKELDKQEFAKLGDIVNLQSESIEEEIRYKENDSDALYVSSPFYQVFSKLAHKTPDYLLKRKDSPENEPVTNIHYNPKFLDHMLRRWMPYVCLWSSLVLKKMDMNISRMTQAYIEAWHRVMKKKVLMDNSNASVGDVVRALERDHNRTIGRIHLGVPLAGTSNSRQKPHYPEEQCNPVSQEGFKRKKKKAKGPGYSQGFRIRKQAEDTSDSDEADIEDEKSQAKTKEPKPALRSRHSAKNTKKDEVPKIKTEKVDDSEKLEGRKTKAHQHAETELTVQEESIYSCGGSSDSSDDLTSILHRKMEENRDIPSRVDSSVGSKNCSIDPNERHRELYEDLPKYINGLVTDPTFYSSSRSRMVNVARYSSHNSAVNNEFSVSARDFSKLMSKNGWLSGDVIDYALANIADQCDDVTHIGTIDSHRIVGEGSDGRHRFPTRWKLLSLKNVKDRIIMGYTFNLHWRLIYINIPAKKFYLLDPYKDGSDEERACRKFKEFLAKCHVDSSFHELAQVDWTFDKMEDLRAYQDPLDSSSCGIFLTCYAEDLALKKALRRQFDIEASRRELGDRILSASENLSERCIHCGLLVDKKGVVCIICHGISHCHCICESHMDSDLEGPDIPCKASYQDAKMYREAKKKIAANLDLSQPFICKLCKRYFEI
ncbi:hypothetical protein QAD02_022808 [Eretmocerus hayati]|uniref:Uncharacterized protein n=1 Tax=Eretmocerus hayati TaxID=131215 RepID=A0ACC2PUN9_9HYME|nr:hypothetical protein QAD02_022808 [Eretmocerus hayati]